MFLAVLRWSRRGRGRRVFWSSSEAPLLGIESNRLDEPGASVKGVEKMEFTVFVGGEIGHVPHVVSFR